MKYYNDNAVYQHFDAHKHPDFHFVKGDAWSLVYGDSNSVPKVMALVSTTDWKEQATMAGLTKNLANRAGLSFFRISFDETCEKISSVIFSKDSGQKTIITPNELKVHFQTVGMPIGSGVASKKINDKESSVYHQWQRANLGRDITVSDIDLFRQKTGERPAEIVELKRSFYDLDSWKPFKDDFKNFDLLYNLSQKCGIDMSILYNRRTKDPVFDDISTVKMFSFKPGSPAELGKFSFQDFLSGKHRDIAPKTKQKSRSDDAR